MPLRCVSRLQTRWQPTFKRSPTSSYIGTWIVLAPSTLRSSAWACAHSAAKPPVTRWTLCSTPSTRTHQANWTTRSFSARCAGFSRRREPPVVKARKSVEHCTRYHQTTNHRSQL